MTESMPGNTSEVQSRKQYYFAGSQSVPLQKLSINQVHDDIKSNDLDNSLIKMENQLNSTQFA